LAVAQAVAARPSKASRRGRIRRRVVETYAAKR
jgi:hypothetical protein